MYGFGGKMVRVYSNSLIGRKWIVLNYTILFLGAAGTTYRIPSSLRKPTSRKRKKSVSIAPSEPLAQFILKSCELHMYM